VAEGGAEGARRQAGEGPGRRRPFTELLRLHQVAWESGSQLAGDAALAHRLPRGGAVVAPQSQAAPRPGQGGVHRGRRGQRPTLAAVPQGAVGIEAGTLTRSVSEVSPGLAYASS